MRKLIHPFILTFSIINTMFGQTLEIPNKENQIAMAVLAGPAELRAEATVMGFDADGNQVIIRKGTNELICRSDDPNKSGFECVCYNQDVEPFMARGRALKKEGKSSKEIFNIREQEAKDGKLSMPNKPSTLHILYGKEASFNSETNEIENASYRYVIYMPWATQESTGLPLKPNGVGHPWLMNPGTHRAHIMVTPAPN
ncbi:MAG: hypothetical protein AAFN93_11190 [Bacteroidota bacterium]